MYSKQDIKMGDTLTPFVIYTGISLPLSEGWHHHAILLLDL